MQNVVDQMSEKHRKANKIPTSKKEAQRRNIDHKFIYSYSTAVNVIYTANRLCRYNSINNLSELTPAHADRYIIYKIRQLKEGIIESSKYVKNEKNRIAKFDQCLLQTGKRSKHDPNIVSIVPVPTLPSDPRGRYTKVEADKIINHIKENQPQEKYLMVKIQRIAGLRIREAVYLKARNIDIKNTQIVIRKEDNITKGGRPRTIQLPETVQIKELLNEIKKDKLGKDRVFNYGVRTIQWAVYDACVDLNIERRGTHGLRGEFAYSRAKQYLEEQGIKATEYRINNMIKKHGNAITDKERNCLGKTSNDLGHGKGRTRVVRNSYLRR